MKSAKNIKTNLTYTLTYKVVVWTCPVCDKRNETEFTEEDELNKPDDPSRPCSYCKNWAIISQSKIYNLD